MVIVRISETAQAAGVGVETVRFYERRGLIEQPAKPTFGGHRRYPNETVERIRFIRRSQGIGFSLREIGELLSLRVDPEADCSVALGHTQDKLAEVDRKIASLQAIKAALEVLVQNCPGRGAISKCSIIDALATADESVELA
ncbi:MAG: MerR family transcriptional regulator [Gammaproteobacteria bacterium]|nr:MAG: MerR family transcriptional regulator [Chloroflexota bacterium]TDJ22337.1 MAG: MerR family transcriptional regulator [Gammaproteobacteria bacterium]